MKVIVASFMKNGTTSLNEAFREFGYNSYDWFESYWYQCDDWTKILKSGGSVNDFRRMYEGVDAVVDNPACLFWEQILEAYPDAKVILSMRDEESWFKSAQKQLHSLSDNWWMVFIHLFSYSGWCHFRFCNRVAMLSNASVRAFPWSRCDTSTTVMTNIYRHHNSYILQKVPKNKLLVYDLRDGWNPLCEFLGEELPNKPFPHANKSATFFSDALKSNSILRGMFKEAILTFSIFATVGIGILYRLCGN